MVDSWHSACVNQKQEVKKYNSSEILRVLLSPTRRKKGSRNYRRTAREWRYTYDMTTPKASIKNKNIWPWIPFGLMPPKFLKRHVFFFFSYTPLKESVKEGWTECNHLYTNCKTSLKNILGNLCEQYRHWQRLVT